MGLYTKALHHVNNKDFKRTRQRILDEKKSLYLERRKKLIEEQNEIKEIKKLAKPYKSDWRKDLSEGMTTIGAEVQFAASDIPLDTIDAGDPNNFTAAVGGFDSQAPSDGLSGAQIVSNGTGSGSSGGFNLGRSYLSFNGVGFDNATSPQFDNKRHVMFTPMDTSRATTLEITAVVGNGFNGGEAPSVGQDLLLYYTDNEQYPNSIIAAVDANGDPITVVPHNGSGSLKTYSIIIPSNEFNDLRKQGIQFVLFQDQGDNPTTTNDNYGIVDIKIKRTTPISVFAPLDSPEAVSFMRVGTGPNMETPEQRYRKITQQLLASKKYTTTLLGSNFPGSNFNGISGVSASPIGDQASYDTWNQASEKNAQQVSSTFTYTYDVVTNSGVQKATYTGTLKSTPTSSPAPSPITQTTTYRGGLTTAGKVTGASPISKSSVPSTQPSPTTQTTTYRGGLTTAGKVTGLTAISKSSVPPTPPKTQASPKLLTPQQLSNLDKQIADLQRQSEKNKQDAVNNQWRVVGELALGALQAAAILTPIPGDEVAVASIGGAKSAGAFARANPGKYNPFLSQQTNKYLNLPRK